MIRVNHPTLPGVSRDVSAHDVASWVAQGWVRAEPVPPRRSLHHHHDTDTDPGTAEATHDETSGEQS